jgi:pyruvate ferredoxin oxidoreductase alpha subunit/phenylglyoxylate dehydrogenase alpha subunit
VEGVDIPSQKEVDSFLPPVHFNHAILDPDNPMAVDSLTSGEVLTRYRKGHLEAMAKALDVIDETDKKFAKAFGRSYGGAIEEYKCDDADIVLVSIGGMTGTARDAVDMARDAGIKVGLIKLRFVRPFPTKRIAKALEGKKAFAVVDRSVCFGWNTGPMYTEVRAALINASNNYSHFSAIGGLGGADISLKHMTSVIQKLESVKNQPGQHETMWLMKEI